MRVYLFVKNSTSTAVVGAREWIDSEHGDTYPVFVKNVTLALDERTVQAARRIAAERSTSLNAMIREFLEELTERESKLPEVRRRIVALCRESMAEAGDRSWTRDELHER